MKRVGVLIVGKGSTDVPIAAGCLVLLHAGSPQVTMYCRDRIVPRCFKLPDDVDTVSITAGSSVDWCIEWFPVKPGYEVPDPTPVSIPTGAKRPESLESTIARLVRRHVDESAEASGYDTEDEEDFNDDDDEGDSPTPYEYEEIGRRAERETARLASLQAFIRKKRNAPKPTPASVTPPATPAEPATSQSPPPAVGSS